MRRAIFTAQPRKGERAVPAPALEFGCGVIYKLDPAGTRRCYIPSLEDQTGQAPSQHRLWTLAGTFTAQRHGEEISHAAADTAAESFSIRWYGKRDGTVHFHKARRRESTRRRAPHPVYRGAVRVTFAGGAEGFRCVFALRGGKETILHSFDGMEVVRHKVCKGTRERRGG